MVRTRTSNGDGGTSIRRGDAPVRAAQSSHTKRTPHIHLHLTKTSLAHKDTCGTHTRLLFTRTHTQREKERAEWETGTETTNGRQSRCQTSCLSRLPPRQAKEYGPTYGGMVGATSVQGSVVVVVSSVVGEPRGKISTVDDKLEPPGMRRPVPSSMQTAMSITLCRTQRGQRGGGGGGATGDTETL